MRALELVRALVHSDANPQVLSSASLLAMFAWLVQVLLGAQFAQLVATLTSDLFEEVGIPEDQHTLHSVPSPEVGRTRGRGERP
mmetsp:Transcript_74045/g.131073  ORF Transcript_74045/g.131073 Transcript_74045/m.131073 type:complete len:84 (-) Transcript_74045:1842-2093(-)